MVCTNAVCVAQHHCAAGPSSTTSMHNERLQSPLSAKTLRTVCTVRILVHFPLVSSLPVARLQPIDNSKMLPEISMDGL